MEYFAGEGNSSTKAFTAVVLAGSLQCCLVLDFKRNLQSWLYLLLVLGF